MNQLTIFGKRGNEIPLFAMGEGPVLLLIHGFPLDHALWESQWNALSREFHVIAPDLGGFGQSTLGCEAYSLGDLAADIEEIRRHFVAGDVPFVIGGLSMGGYIAFEYARHHADKLAGLVLANTKPDADSMAARQKRLDIADSIEQTQQLGDLPDNMARNLLGASVDAGIQQKVRAMIARSSPAAIVAAQRAMSDRRDSKSWLNTFEVPTLVIAGEVDSLMTVEDTIAWSELLPKRQFVSIPDAGHLTPIESPAAFNEAVVSWWRACKAA